MDEKKTSLKKEVEDTLACSAFAEEGEPCPENIGEESSATAQTSPEEEESILESVEDTLACSAFADENEPCPENIGEKSK
ncbi:MAG: hypothetical protein NTY00_01545 [Deltaproteobacteria bacterium]|nr:hypothetical protein [Deltaproteobacteria bacterium]